MTVLQITNIIKSSINDSIAGLSKENPKLDFKRQWYDLTSDIEINEFIKDSSSIANTPGLDGFIVIGFDDASNTYKDAVFSDCKLRDTSDLQGMLIKRVDRNYEIINYDILIDGHKLSVLHIPPSFDKPHVIKNYKYKTGKEEQHRTWIRSGTTTRLATKYDLDFIAYDRKNHIPEYSLFVSTSKTSINPFHSVLKCVDLNVVLIIENNGLRPVAISEVILTFFYEPRTLSFVSQTNKEETFNTIIKSSNIIIQPSSIKNCSALVFTKQGGGMTDSEFKEYQIIYNSFTDLNAKIKLNNERIIETKVQLIN